MNLRPLHDKLIIKLQEAETQTAGGLIIANAKNEGIVKAEVLASGPGTYDSKGNFIEVSTKPGSTILVNNMAGQKFKHDEVEYVTISENEIVAVLS